MKRQRVKWTGLLRASTRKQICAVNYLLAKERVVGSNPIFHSDLPLKGVIWTEEYGPSDGGP